MAHVRKPYYRLLVVDFANNAIDVDSYACTVSTPDAARDAAMEIWRMITDFEHSGFIRVVKVLPNGNVSPFILLRYGNLSLS